MYVSRLIKKEQLRNVGEIEFDISLFDTVYCSAALHFQYRSVIGQVNWLFNPGFNTGFDTASQGVFFASAGSTVVDVRVLNKLAISVRSEPCALKYWPLKGNLRLVGCPDVAYRNYADNNTQRGQTIFIAEERRASNDGF